MKKYTLCFTIVVCASVYAQVDRTELGQDLPSVSFSNYTGTHTRIDTWDQIRSIGYDLGLAIRNGASQAGTPNRYFVIHTQTPPEDNRLDADIVGLGPGVLVDHIRNLRLIIQGYLEAAYQYTAADARLLAEYITVYNAVYRSEWEYFQNRYKPSVLGYITPDYVGLATYYGDWAGQTFIVVPLGTSEPGSLSAVDTSIISDARVVEEIRNEDDKGIDLRKEMVDLKEREAAEAERSATERGNPQRVVQTTPAREPTPAQTGGARQNTGNQNNQNNQNQQSARAPSQPSGNPAGNSGTGSDQGLVRRADPSEQNQQEAARQATERAEQKMTEAQQERELIAFDQGKIVNAPPLMPEGIVALVLTSNDSPLGYLVKIDPSSGKELKRAPLNTVNVRTVTVVGGRIFVIAGAERLIRLAEIDRDNLVFVREGADSLSRNSLLWHNNTDIYAITSDGYIARFTMELVKQAQSTIQVHPYAAVLFQGEKLLTQRSNG
ncbi:MAG: hypothetical protein LBQ77_07905, partial [Treponema sp.]|nr:hypothetical protein [Treponema sp.]